MNARLTRRAVLSGAAGIAALATGLHPVPARAQDASPPAPYGLPIDPAQAFGKAGITVKGAEMAYIDEGEGPAVLFLHGNPTSSYLWRNVIPHVTAAGYRAVAPDLIGMGDSAKPEIGYTFLEHYDYLAAFVEALDLNELTLVAHDWGSALGIKLAREMPDRVRALAYMEAIVAPSMPAPSYEAMGEPGSEMFRALRTEGLGEEMILKNNFFVEEVLPKFGVLRGLGEAEMVHYRAPYETEASRLPTLVWPRQIPIGGAPAEVAAEIEANSAWLTGSDLPKLLFWAEPGALMPRAAVDWHVARVPNLETRFLGAGLHFLQEDHPDQIGYGLADWLRRN